MPDPNLVHYLENVRRADRWRVHHQAGTTVWFTGPGVDRAAAIAKRIEARLLDVGRSAYLIDAGTLGHGLCSDLGPSRGDHDEFVRRAAELARLFADAGMAALVAIEAPSARLRDWVRGRHEQDHLPFIEVFAPGSIGTADEPFDHPDEPFAAPDEPFAAPDDPEVTLSPAMSQEQAVEVVLARVVRELRRGRHLT